MNCHSLLQGIFPTQGSNPGLPYCRQIIYIWATREAPIANNWTLLNQFFFLWVIWVTFFYTQIFRSLVSSRELNLKRGITGSNNVRKGLSVQSAFSSVSFKSACFATQIILGVVNLCQFRQNFCYFCIGNWGWLFLFFFFFTSDSCLPRSHCLHHTGFQCFSWTHQPCSYLRVFTLDLPSGENARLPRWLSGKEFSCQCRKRRFDPWIGKILWRRKWQPTPVFLPGKSHGQRSLVGYSPWGCKESDTSEQLNTHVRTLEKMPSSGKTSRGLGQVLPQCCLPHLFCVELYLSLVYIYYPLYLFNFSLSTHAKIDKHYAIYFSCLFCVSLLPLGR